MTTLFVGLGNPGHKFVATRHNIGVRILKLWTETHAEITTPWKILPEFEAEGAQVGTTHCLFPMTGMNVSGKAVARYVKKNNIELNRILIIHDELEIPVGQFAIKEQGSAAGHNGVRSIHEALETQEIRRLRIGIGRPEDPQYPIDHYVLEPFTEDERNVLEGIVPALMRTLTQISSKAQEE